MHLLQFQLMHRHSVRNYAILLITFENILVYINLNWKIWYTMSWDLKQYNNRLGMSYEQKTNRPI